MNSSKATKFRVEVTKVPTTLKEALELCLIQEKEKDIKKDIIEEYMHKMLYRNR